MILDAAQACLCQDGYARFSTRRVAEQAGVPLSQIHYHFGSKQGLVLAVLEDQNQRLLQRQTRTFSEPMPLSRRWERACDYLDEDLSSGYVRVLQEMIAAGWSDPQLASAVRSNLQGWYDLLTGLAEEAGHCFGGLGPFAPTEVACLIGHAFIGSEALILVGLESPGYPDPAGAPQVRNSDPAIGRARETRLADARFRKTDSVAMSPAGSAQCSRALNSR